MNVIDPKIRIKLIGGSHSGKFVVIDKGLETLRMSRKYEVWELPSIGDARVSNVTMEHEEYVVNHRNRCAYEKSLYDREMKGL